MPIPIFDIIGLVAGVAGIVIATWLQLVVPQPAPPRLVTRFAFAGLALVAMSSEAFIGNTDVLLFDLLRGFAYLTLIALEVTGLSAVRSYLYERARIMEIQRAAD